MLKIKILKPTQIKLLNWTKSSLFYCIASNRWLQCDFRHTHTHTHTNDWYRLKWSYRTMRSKKSVFTWAATNTLYNNDIFSGTIHFFLQKWSSDKQIVPVPQRIQSVFMLLCNVLWGKVKQNLHCAVFMVIALNNKCYCTVTFLRWHYNHLPLWRLPC